MNTLSKLHKASRTVLAGIAFLVSLGIALGWCDACQYVAHWANPIPQYIASIGALATLLIMLSSFSKSERVVGLGDALLCFCILFGAWLVIAAISAQIPLCPWCQVFWVIIGLLLLELIISKRSITKLAIASILCCFFVITSFSMSPHARWQLSQFFPRPIPPQIGPKIGTTLPVKAKLPQNGMVAIVTECAPCARAALLVRLSTYRSKGRNIVVIVAERNKVGREIFSNYDLIRADESFFRSVHMRQNGPPILVELKDGTVVKSAPPGAFPINK